jgi:cobalt/nickel transport system permease protein
MPGPLLHLSTDLVGLVRAALRTERTATADGLLQRVAPAVRLLGVVAVLVAAALTADLAELAGLCGLALSLAVASRVPLRTYLARTAVVATLSVVVVLPRLVLTPGPAVLAVGGVAVTRPGVAYVAVFGLRVAASVAFATLLILTTPFPALVAALRRLGAPAGAATLLSLTYRYLFLCVADIHRALLARDARRLRPRGRAAEWRELGALAGGFLLRTVERGDADRPASPYRRSSPLGPADAAFAALAVGALALVVAP